MTAYGTGGATIIAEATDPDDRLDRDRDGNLQLPAGPSHRDHCGLVLSRVPRRHRLLSTLTVYNEGLNTTNWLVTAPSATGTPNVLHCGPGSNGAGFGGSVCVATYPVGTTVILTAPAGAEPSADGPTTALPTTAVTAAGPNTCTVTLTFDDTVGAIFN